MDIDPRGPRFGALITTVVFAVVLITGSVWLLAAQALVFAVATVFGMRNAPYGLIYRWLVRPRLGPPGELEPEAPPRFAQGHGGRLGRLARGVPERGLRALPGLRDVSAHPTYLAGPPGTGAGRS